MEKIDQAAEELAAGNRFDASQYAFFGRDVTQEIELGGLGDEDEEVDANGGLDEEELFASSTADRDEIVGASSELDDPAAELSTSFARLRTENHHDEPTFVDPNALPADLEPTSWLLDNEKPWPPQQQRQHFVTDADASKPFVQWGREGGTLNLPYALQKQTSQPQGAWPAPPPVQLQTPGSPSANPQYRQPFPNMQLPQYHAHQLNPWLLQAAPPGSPVGRQAMMMQPQLRPLPGPGYPQYHPVMVSQGQSNGSTMVEQMVRSRQGQVQVRPPVDVRKNAETSGGNGNGGNPSTPPVKSKYMSTEELQNLVRIQWAATHSTDPYIDDYYHQAVQTKLAGGTPHGRRHFAPSHLRDIPPHCRSAAEPHAFLQVDALGRMNFSSIRRPRPLLDVDMNTAGDKAGDSAASQRRLEQEPMLAARIAVEDGLCLLLDVDDIDRMLAVSQPADGGAQLRRRRHYLLEGLASSFQLVDPLAPRDASGRFGVAAADDLVFLRLVSLPKGRKLLARYLKLLLPGTDLVRIVAMAVFRHLNFLFGASVEPGLAAVVAATTAAMDLGILSACLAAVVLASERPPLRPIGSPAGDGATVILQAVLDRATAILSDRSGAVYVQYNTTVWQASFDAFFNMLSDYCNNKYESITHSLLMSAGAGVAVGDVNAAAGAAMAKEMPVELLRASLPHTNDLQRKRLLEFAQRSFVAQRAHSGVGGDGHAAASTAAVRG